MMYPILESQSDSENNKIASPVDHTSPSIKRNNDYNSDSLKININNGNNNNGGSNGVTTSSSSSGEPNLPYPGFPEISLKYLTQDTRPRNWCLWLITNPQKTFLKVFLDRLIEYVLNTWFGRISILVVLLNCITLGMKQPCVDKECVTNQCRMLQSFDHIIFLFFSLEMIIKMIAMGVSGKNSYLTDVWNRLDFLFVLVGAFEYCVAVNNLHFTIYLFIRIIRVLSPLRAISRIPSMRILVMPLLDSLPKLGNVLLLYFFVFLIFGIIGVQLWEGILRQRCAMQLPQNVHNPGFTIPFFYDFSMEQDYICSKTEDSGMHDCVNLPRYRIGSMICNDPALPANANNPTENGCVNWNQYYTKCEQLGSNPSQGKISFDNIGLAWVAISLVISLEGWSDIMYYVQDAHSFWVWIYFVLLIVIGSFFMISLFLIVIATQFSITKNRERDRIRHQERAIFASTSSSTTNKYQKQQRIDGLHEFVTPIYKVLSNIFCCMLKSVCRIVELLSFFLLLLLFIFIFSILGMDLFGCKSCENIEDTKPCDRQNFGSLLWASVTVFQILTQGEWKAVLFNQMEKNSHWSSLYFVTLMTFGNYVLFNLLVAILVDGFRSKRNKMREQRELLKAKSCEEHFSVKLNDLMAENLRHSAEELRKSNLIRGNNGQSKKLSQDSPNPTLDSESSIKHWENRSLEEIDKPLYGSIPLLLKPRSVLTSLKTIDDRICLDLVPTPITHNKNETNGMTETNINNSFNPEIEKLQALSETDLNKLNQKSSSNVNLPEHDGSTKSSEHNCCRETYSLYMFPPKNRFRQICIWLVHQKWFDNAILLFIVLNCITLAMEGPNYMPLSTEGFNLATANYIFTVIFAIELFIKVIAAGMFYGPHAYFRSGWNIMDGLLIIISIIDLLMSLISPSPRILKVFRLLRSLRPLRVINGVHGLKLVVQTLLSSLRPIGNILLICCAFFIIFGILGIQLFKGTFYRCQGDNVKGVRNKTECFTRGDYWVNEEYNFDNLGKALLSLFVLWSRDGWVNIVYTGLDAVGVDQQPIVNYNEWRLLYFIAFILLVGFFVLHMFVGVAVENFHRYCEKQKREEKIKRPAKEALQMGLHEPPYYSNYSSLRLFVHNVVTSKYFDLAIAAVIGLNVVTMTMEYYMMPVAFYNALEIFNYFITVVLLLEAIMKLVALGIKIYMKDKWNQLDVVIVILSILEIILENLERINPKIIRVMRVLRIARVLKLLKMAKGIRALLDTVLQALLQVGNLGLLLFLLFFIFAQLGVELYGQLECSDEKPCHGLGEHAHFENFGMAFLTLLRVATRDNWNDIMKDTLRDQCDDSTDCVNNCCVNTVIAKIFFVVFVLMTQFVLVNVVVAVLMKHLEESHKQMEETMDISDNNSKTVPIGSQKLPVHGLDSVAVTNDRLL